MDRVDRFTQAYSQAPWRKQLQLLVMFSLILAFLALVAGIYLDVTARTATAGREIQKMQRLIDRTERENAALQAQLALVTSATEMEKRADALGFQPVQAEQMVYLRVPGYLGRQPASIAPASIPSLAKAPVVPPEYTESVFSWVVRQIDLPEISFLQVKP